LEKKRKETSCRHLSYSILRELGVKLSLGFGYFTAQNESMGVIKEAVYGVFA